MGKDEKLLKEIRTENYPNVSEDITLQNQEAEQMPNRMYPKKSSKDTSVKHLKLKTKKKCLKKS